MFTNLENQLGRIWDRSRMINFYRITYNRSVLVFPCFFTLLLLFLLSPFSLSTRFFLCPFSHASSSHASSTPLLFLLSSCLFTTFSLPSFPPYRLFIFYLNNDTSKGILNQYCQQPQFFVYFDFKYILKMKSVAIN